MVKEKGPAYFRQARMREKGFFPKGGGVNKLSLKGMRLARQLTQEDVARAVGVSRVAVLKWERGDNPPKMKYAIKLAKLFGCRVEDIIKMYA